MTDLAEQRQRNLKSREDWARYASHRQRVTECILGVCTPSHQTLAVLGAGNCNDIELAELASRYSAIRLVDLDEEAMKWGLQHQGNPAGVTTHQADLGGLVGAETPEAVCPSFPWPDPVDVCVSVCLLSQIVEAASQQDNDSQRWIDAVVAAHMNLLASSLSENGTAILISDFLSSQTCPGVTPAATSQELEQTLRLAFVQGNFFRGLHPGQLRQRMQESMSRQGQVEIRLTSPWVWEHSARNYVVVALIAANSGEVTV